MVIPNAQGSIRHLNIHIFSFFITFFVLLGINTYFLCRYPLRIAEIVKLEQHIHSLRSDLKTGQRIAKA